jgi:catechol 2,3-dioxygenase-like lactoylglutathione lyase family enzyme
MDIRQFRVVLRAKHFDRTCSFYGETLALPRLGEWERDGLRGARFEAGTGALEVIGRAVESPDRGDEDFDYVGPKQKLTLNLLVPSADKAYETLLFRDRNIPGGLREDPAGGILFETHDPDGVKILFREGG